MYSLVLLSRLSWSTDLQTLQNLKLPTQQLKREVSLPFPALCFYECSKFHMYVDSYSVCLFLHLFWCGGMCMEVKRQSAGVGSLLPGITLKSWGLHYQQLYPLQPSIYPDWLICLQSVFTVHLGVWFSLLSYKLDNWYFVYFLVLVCWWAHWCGSYPRANCC